MRWLASILLLVVAIAAAEETRKAVPLVDPAAVQPDEDPLPPRIEEDPVVAPEIERPTYSSSRQFLIFGGSPDLRGSVAIQAESVRDRFHRVLGIRKEPSIKLPIEIRLVGEAGDEPKKRPVAFELRYFSDKFLLRIHVDLARGIDRDLLERAILKALVCERTLRDRKPGDIEARMRVPVWLVEGLREADLWLSNRADRTLYEGVFRQKSLFTTAELFAVDEESHRWLDGVSREAFRALSGAMVMALLEQPDGREAFLGFCDEVASYDGDMPILLRKYFPELNLSERSLAKWWALTMARLADVPLTEVMGVAATDRGLDEALQLHYRDAEGINRRVGLHDWSQLGELGEVERLLAVRPAQEAVNRLSYRCFPSYRPLLKDYQDWLGDWASGKRLKTLDERLAELDETRAIMRERSEQARHFLNWREIVEAGAVSGEFDDYLRFTRELERSARSPRTDPVTRYLDVIDKAYAGDGGKGE